MKKDFFNGNIKHQFVSSIWTTIIIAAVIFFGLGGFFIYLPFSDAVVDKATAILLLCLGVVAFLFGIWYSFGTIFIIRSYPKHKKIIKWFLNSDYYFVGSDSKELHGHWRGKTAFDAATSIADRNEVFTNIKYPKKYYYYIWATVICIILMFADLIGAYLVLNSIEKSPQYSQDENTLFGFFVVFMLLELAFMILSFVFAFRVKKIREITREEYLKKLLMGSDK